MSGIKKVLGIFIAMNGVGIGVGIFLQCGLGSDPIGIICDGLSCFLCIQFGHASLIYNLLLICLAFLVARTNIGAGTIVYALLSGYFIDLYNYILSFLDFHNMHIVAKLSFYIIGELFFAFALALLIYFKFGMNALDALIYKIEDVTNISYAKLRTFVDIFYSVVGSILGGVFGIGTIISILFTGTFVNLFTKKLDIYTTQKKERKLIKKSIKKYNIHTI